MTAPYEVWVRWRRCGRKVPMTWLEANRRVLEAWRDGDGALQPYRCPYGQHWHVGHENESTTKETA